jgi:hypothetical protein
VRYKVGILDDTRPTPPGTPRSGGGSGVRRASRSTSRNSNSSDDHHGDDDDDEKEQKRPRTLIVPIFENQRFFPLRGWSEKLLPTDVPTWYTYAII